ncbi:MAG: hypothetical protein ABL908_14815, partial [Hyphomicrobium sp.]
LFLLWAALDPAPSMRAFDLIVYAHLLIGGLAMAGYGHRRGWPVAASILAAAVFMFGGAAAGRLNHTGIICSYGLFPLAMLTLELTLERRSALLSIAFAMVASVIALGRNQVALLLCFVLLALAIRHILAAEHPLRYLRQRAGCLALMGLTGVVILAAPLLLTVQFATLSNRPSLDLATALQASLHPASLLSMAVPNVFGSLNMMDLGYWGPQASITPEVAATDDSFNYAFFGAVPIVLLFALGVCRGVLVQRGSRTWTAILALSVLFALGRYTPLFGWVFEHVPGFTYFRRPIDGLFITGIALAILCGDLLSAFVRHGSPPANRWATRAAVASGVGLVAGALALSNLTGHMLASSIEIANTLPVVLLAAGLLCWPMAAAHRVRAAHLLTLLAIGQLVGFNAASRLNGEPLGLYRALEAAPLDEQAALDLLARELARRHREGARPRVEIIGMGGAWQNLAMVHGLEATNGYNPLRIGLYDRMVIPGESPAVAADRSFTRTFNGYDCPLARALGLEYLVIDRPITELEQQRMPRRVDTLLGGPEIWIYRFGPALPRVKFHTRVEVADADALTSSGRLQHPPDGEHAVLDDETPPSHRVGAWLAAAQGEAKLLDWRPGRIEIDVVAPAAGVLIVHDTYYPGWVARIDGEATPILRADTLFRGVEVPAGRHRVVMQFAPLSRDNLAEAAAGLFRSGHAAPVPKPLTTLPR